MRHVTAIALIVLVTGAATPAVRAADLISYPTSTTQQVPVAPATQSSFDWSGFYAGVYGAYRHGTTSGNQYGLGVDLGVTTTFNYVLAGAEVAVEGLGGDSASSYVQGLARGGVLVNDNTLLYGAAGYGGDTGAAGGSDALVGGGLEFAVTDNVTLRGQYLHGFPVTGGNAKDEVTLGAQFHF